MKESADFTCDQTSDSTLGNIPELPVFLSGLLTMAGHCTAPEDAADIDCNVFETPFRLFNASILLFVVAQMEVSGNSLHSFFRNVVGCLNPIK